MKVRDADGHVWSVRRRWLLWRWRLRDATDFTPSADGADDPVSFVVLLVVGIVILPLLMIAVVAVLELAVLLLLLPVALVVFGLVKGWRIEVRREDETVSLHRVRGWRASRRRIRAIGEAIQTRPPMSVDAARQLLRTTAEPDGVTW